ncbi:MAG TPA: Rrf2 family transcriptional regulator [Bacteroidales bacterium]|nr:Rrf2 family transcriptional regulator [Bacteroidales bacterium]HNR42856.1 Rrf2 family transcriptional regulator [Bacteroidales bacterium]
MLLGNTAQYALRILLYMSEKPGRKYPASELIRKLNISDKYLRKIMTHMAKAGFVESIRGRYGGYVFRKPVQEITIGDIIFSIEGKGKYMECMLGLEKCDDEHPCRLHGTWFKIRTKILDMFDNTSLEDLIEVSPSRD